MRVLLLGFGQCGPGLKQEIQELRFVKGSAWPDWAILFFCFRSAFEGDGTERCGANLAALFRFTYWNSISINIQIFAVRFYLG